MGDVICNQLIDEVIAERQPLQKIHNDILSILDAQLNAVVFLFNLSAAFDTINHDLLLGKLSAESFFFV